MVVSGLRRGDFGTRLTPITCDREPVRREKGLMDVDVHTSRENYKTSEATNTPPIHIFKPKQNYLGIILDARLDGKNWRHLDACGRSDRGPSADWPGLAEDTTVWISRAMDLTTRPTASSVPHLFNSLTLFMFMTIF